MIARTLKSVGRYLVGFLLKLIAAEAMLRQQMQKRREKGDFFTDFGNIFSILH